MTSIESTTYPPAHRFLLEICFDGSGYGGWQIQPRRPTVQDVLQRTLSRLYGGVRIHVIGSSRTDAGVHALGFAASFLAPERPAIPMEKVRSALNRLMPSDVRVVSIREVPLAFHARHDALGKAYTYVLNLGGDSPFSSRYSWRPRRAIRPDLMHEASRRLVGTHDFSSFVVERGRIEDAVRTIYRIDQDCFGSYVCMTFVGNGFLYKMIRCMVGAIEAAGAGAIPPDGIDAILAAGDRAAAPDTAPPHGLFLDRVFYDGEEMRRFRLEHVPFFR